MQSKNPKSQISNKKRQILLNNIPIRGYVGTPLKYNKYLTYTTYTRRAYLLGREIGFNIYFNKLIIINTDNLIEIYKKTLGRIDIRSKVERFNKEEVLNALKEGIDDKYKELDKFFKDNLTIQNLRRV